MPEWAQQNNAINSQKLLTFFQELLEKKVDYCKHLLKVAQSLCPGPSEMRGYLLFECVGARLRLAQWHWIRMKITTPIYLEQLLEIKADLTEVAEILGPIRKDSDEGQMGIKAKAELKTLSKLIDEMSEQTKKSYAAATLQSSGNGNKMASRTASSATLGHRTSVSGLGALTSAVNNNSKNNSSDRYNNRYSVIV